MTDTTSAALIAEIQEKQARIAWTPWMLAVVVVVPVVLLLKDTPAIWTITTAVVLGALAFLVHQHDQLKKSVVLMYDLSGESQAAFERVCSAVEALAACGGVWHFTGQQTVQDGKYHAGASHVVARKDLKVSFHNPPYVSTNLSPPSLKFASHTLFFLPDWVLVFEGSKTGALPYNDLVLTPAESRFIEAGRVPGDAKVVDRTWRYVNKKGGPDKRFKDNRELPVCLYGELTITSRQGLSEVAQFSQLGVAERFTRAIDLQVLAVEAAQQAETTRLRTKATSAADAAQTQGPAPSALASPPVDPELLQVALFDILACLMVVDGEVAPAERERLCEILRGRGNGLSPEACQARINAFIRRVKAHGFNDVLKASLLQLQIIQRAGQARFVLTALELIAGGDGAMTDHENKLIDLVRKQLGAT